MVQMARLRYTKLDPQIPDIGYATSGDAGIDLISTEEYHFYHHYHDGDYSYAATSALVGTGIAVEIPEGCFGMLVGRSSLGVKKNIRLANSVGIVDSGYRGEVMVALHYDGDSSETIEAGERIAQLVIIPFVQAQLELVEELSDSERGTGGFGSTGS